MNRPPVDILSVVTAAYRYVWAERFYVLRLGMVPFVVACINTILVGVIENDISFLRRGLLMLPSILVEAWFVTQFLRTLLAGERWPQPLPNPMPRPIPTAILLRARGLLGAIVVYLLTSLVINAALGSLLTAYPAMVSGAAEDSAVQSSSEGMGIATVMMAVAIVQFRLFFMHIPMVVNIPFRSYLSITHRGMVNIHMMAVWIAVQIPVLVVTFMMIPPLAMVSMGTDMVSYMAFLGASVFSVMSQMVMAVLGSTAMALLLFPTLVQRGGR